MQKSYHYNIYSLYLIKLSKWLMLIMPIVALFYNKNGLNDFAIFSLQAIYSLSVALLEIPSGYMADVIGRRKTLILGSIFGFLGYLFYSLSSSFSGFILAEITLGLGGSLISGADSAMLYDSLAAMRRRHQYLQFEGRITSLGNFAETGAAICGGLIAAFLSYRAVYISQTIIASLAIPAAFFLLEPPRQSMQSHPGIQHIWTVCKDSIFYNKKLSSTIFVSAITGIATLSMAWCAQIYFVTNDFSAVTITPLWVALNLTVAIVAAFAAKAKAILGNRISLLLIICYIPLAYILLGSLPLLPALLSLFFFYAIRGYATPVLKDYINSNCASATRATVLSIRSMIIRIGFTLLGPAIGFISETRSLSFALALTGILLFILSATSGFFLYRQLPENFSKKEFL